VFAPGLSILIAVTSNFLLAAMMTADKMVMEKLERFIGRLAERASGDRPDLFP
jgi:hypothetical protein